MSQGFTRAVVGGTLLTTGSTYYITSSFATSASWSPQPSIPTSVASSSWASSSISSSYSLTASYALNGGSGGTSLGTGSTYPITSSWSNNSLTASYFNQLWLNTGSTYPITASYATNAFNASSIDFIPNTSYFSTQSLNSTQSIYSISSSWASSSISSSYSPVEPNYSASVSSVKQNTLTNTLYVLTASLSTSASYAPVDNNYSSSIVNQLGTKQPTLTNTLYVLTASLSTTSSYVLSASYAPSTPSLTATSASWASSSISSSVLSTPRLINGVSFNGSANISVQGDRWSPVLMTGITYGKDAFTFLRTSGAGGWDAKFYSKQGFTSSLYASCKATSTNQSRIFGLNSNPTAAIIDYSDIDYGFFIVSDGTLLVYEAGSQKASLGNYTTNSVFDITYDGSNIKYWFNGVGVYSTARAIGLPLYMDCFLNTVNNEGLTDIQFGSLPFVPTQNGAYDIGSTTNKFNNGYFSGSVTAPNFVGTASYAPSNVTYAYIYIDSAAMRLGLSSSAAVGSFQTGSVNNSLTMDTIDFDSTISESAQFKLIMPEDWNKNGVKAKVAWITSNATTGSVVWNIKAASVDGTINLGSSSLFKYGLNQFVTSSNIGAYTYNLTNATPAITVGNTGSYSNMTVWNVMRTTSSYQNLAADASLLGVWIQYQTTSSIPAGW